MDAEILDSGSFQNSLPSLFRRDEMPSDAGLPSGSIRRQHPSLMRCSIRFPAPQDFQPIRRQWQSLRIAVFRDWNSPGHQLEIDLALHSMASTLARLAPVNKHIQKKSRIVSFGSSFNAFANRANSSPGSMNLSLALVLNVSSPMQGFSPSMMFLRSAQKNTARIVAKFRFAVYFLNSSARSFTQF